MSRQSKHRTYQRTPKEPVRIDVRKFQKPFWDSAVAGTYFNPAKRSRFSHRTSPRVERLKEIYLSHQPPKYLPSSDKRAKRVNLRQKQLMKHQQKILDEIRRG